MITALSIILFVLLILIGGKRGFKTFLTIYFNLGLLMLLIIIVGWGFNPTIPTFIICIVISTIILFFLNGYNKKTLSSFISVLITLIIFLGITILLGSRVYIQGYTEETIEAISYVEFNTGINMLQLSNCMIIIGLIGNIIDTSIAISSALYEVHVNNPHLSKLELFVSGMNIGKDILGTTTNTLFFAYLGSYMTLIIFFQDHGYSLSGILNAKVFAQEFTRIMLSGTASFLIIPLSSIITAINCTKEKDDYYEKNEYYLREQRDSSSRQESSRTDNSNREKGEKHPIRTSKRIRKKTIS